MRTRAMVFMVLLAAFLLGGCAGKGGTGSDDGSVSLAGVDTSSFPDWLVQAAQPDDATLPLAADEKIVDAFKEKGIDIDDYFTLRFAAAFDPEALPARYASDPDAEPPFDHAFLFAQLRTRWDELSPATQERLKRYTLPSDDPDSYWYADDMPVLTDAEAGVKLAGPSTAVARALDWLTIVPAAGAVINKDPNGKSFAIHYGDGQLQEAQWLVDALTYAHDKYVAAGFPEPKDWVYVKIDPAVKYGEESMVKHGDRKRCHINIQPGMTKELTQSVAAHELFHCFQEYIPLKSYDSEEEWVWESSAVWAEEFAYPTHNTEHRNDKRTWRTFNTYFFSYGDGRDYARYLWWYYLYERAGDSYVPVRDTLLAAKDGQKEAIEARPNLVEEFKEYALWGLNTEPYKRYHDTGGLPAQTPSGRSKSAFIIEKGDRDATNADLAEGGIRYLYHYITDDVKKVEFDLTQVNREANPKGGVQMISELGDGSTVLRDVTDEEKVTFCRNRDEEKVNAVLFIVDNADLENTHLGEIPYDAGGECVPRWTGTITATWNYQHADTAPTLSGVDGTTQYTETGSIVAHDTLVYDEEWDDFLLKSLDFSYDYREEYTVTYPRDCGILGEYELDTMKGGGTRSWEIDEKWPDQSSAPTRLEGDDEHPGGPYTLDLEEVAGTFASHDVKRLTRKPCPLEGIATPGPGTGSEDVFDNTYDANEAHSAINWPNTDVVLTMSPDKKRLTGSGDAYLQYGDTRVPVTIEAEYRYG